MNYRGLRAPRIAPPLAIRVIAAAAVAATLCAAALAGAAEGYESPPAQSPADLLPPALVSGANFKVVDPVPSDGLMHHYVLDTKWGKLDAYGRVKLEMRVREAHALTEISKTSKFEVVAGSVGRGAVQEVETVGAVATHPIKTVTGIPKGIAHLFHGYSDQAKEAVAETKKSGGTGSGGKGEGVVAKGGDAAARYAKRYLGVSAAELRYYKHYGLDPYTDNSVLRDAIHRNANVEAATGLGLRFAALPGIPGVGIMARAEDAIYNEDPATIRARNRATLAGYGLAPAEIAQLENSLVLSPARQVLLLEAAASLDGVDGRAEIFRHALGLTSDAEAQVYLQSVGLLVLAHRAQPVKAVLPGVRLPAGRRADGGVVVCGAFEAVYWTADVARGERQVRESLPQSGVPGRELCLAGSVSERARGELEQLGWTVRPNLAEPAAAAP